MKNLIYLIAVLFIIACSKEEPTLPGPQIKEGVCLSELKVGQQSVFQQYTTHCDDLEGNFEYTGSTLTLTIIEKDAKLFAKEDFYYPVTDTTFTVEYEVYNEGKFIVIPDRLSSWLFNFYDNDRIDLEPESTIDLDQNACQIFHSNGVFEGNDIGVLDKFELGDMAEKDLTLVSCEPIFEVEAYLMYNKNELVASHLINLEGWDDPVPSFIQGWILKTD